MSVHDADYKKVKELLGIPEDEPIFVLRAQDRLSLPTIQRYANFAAQVEATVERPEPFSQEWLANKDAVIEEFSAWQQEHSGKVKLPD
jgi:hypothetical protein